MQGGFPLDLILFAMVAAFLVLRLRSVLGRRTGFERPPQEQPAGSPPLVPGQAEAPPTPAASGAKRGVPDPQSQLGQTLLAVRRQDPGFDPYGFLNGAEGAFRMIVEAFARGDRATLQSLLSAEAYGGFEQAIASREQAGQTQRTELRAIHEAAIEGAELRGSVADITVRFVSDQVNLTMGPDGSVVHGAEAVTEITDFWTFQRDLSQSDPTWKLIATHAP